MLHSSARQHAIFDRIHDAKGSFSLYRTVHPQESALYAFQVFNHFFVHRCQFLIDPDSSVPVCLFAFFCIRAPGTVFTPVYLLLATVLVAVYMLVNCEDT